MENQRKKIIVNARYQIRLAAIAVSLTILTINILLIAGALFPKLVGFSFLVEPNGALVIAISESLLFLFVWFSSLRFSHRVAGPIFAFQSALQKLEQGDFSTRLRLREKDEFHDMADSMNQSIRSVDLKLHAVMEKLESAQAITEVEQIQASLGEIQEVMAGFTLSAKDRDENP